MRCLGAVTKNVKKNKRVVALIAGAFLLLQYAGFGISRYSNPDVEDFSCLEFFEDFASEWMNPISWAHNREFSTVSPTVVEDARPLCPEYPQRLVGNVSSSNRFMQDRSWAEIIADNKESSDDGFFSPKNCKPRHKIAVIIPIRGRETQLRILLSHMLPIWRRQQIEFGVYTISQAGSGLFNRAKLINVGVAEAIKDRNYDCYVFHDVDLLLEDDRCLYWCHKENPRHIAMYMDKFSYKPLKYTVPCSPVFSVQTMPYFGGVSMLTHKQFIEANGFSNLYWGWGGEDDDAYFRLWKKGYSLANPYDNKCSFKMIPHQHEASNAENEGRYSLLYYSISRMENDGFRSLKYRLLSKKNMNLYKNITVDIGKPTRKMVDFISRELPWLAKCAVRMPWQ